ncbi:murein DD-endopeptidase MepM/ murein hydrolase activator NlpD [Sphingomonas insulae]|uniref:M23 family metallopeptidase n=1 Tax=Sphingomonas insulae TaxID=424800 RepID=A0ABP3SZQ5_9SPHN|nr:M23 family metallopeptidase [Sphingomonas insulae]NIJ30254.1 murein DD-endopeptidase MepM/ murein hydrolase activator NlpD [Sphingomonas insulae]
MTPAAALALLATVAAPATAQLAPAVAAPTAQVDPAAATFRMTGPVMQGGLIVVHAPRDAVSVTLDGKALPLAPDGLFVVGFDRDAGPQAMLAAVLADGRQVTRALAVAPRAWRIERLDTLPRFPAPDPVMAQLRPAELARIVAARALSTDAQGWRQPFVWPATGRISGLFGAQRIYRGEPGAYHSGTDIARPTGSPVVAPADGVVILAADHPFTLEGNLLMIDHGDGLNSAFLHLSRIDVKVGDHVRQGQTVGAVGATGRATGPHLHWSLRWRDARLDPMLLAGAMPAQ